MDTNLNFIKKKALDFMQLRNKENLDKLENSKT